MKLTVALLALAFSLHATAADAIPAAFVITQLGITGALATAATYAAVGLANYGLSRLLSSTIAGEASNPGIKTKVRTEGGTVGQNLVLGRTALAGNLTAPMYAYGDSGKYENSDRWTILDLADKPITDVTAIWVDGTKLEPADFDAAWDTAANAGKGAKVIAGKYAEQGDSLYFRLFKGKQTTAAVGLTDRFSTHSKRPWTSAMIGKGVAYGHFLFEYDPDVYRGEPEVLFEVKGSALYDPRKDSTRGGAGTHRLNNESTWEYTENPKVIQYNIFLGIPMPDGTTFGLDVDPDDLPLDYWVADMNKCDEDVNGEPRYTAGVNVRIGLPEYGGTTPLDIIDKLDAACDGEVADVGGVWYTRCGGPGLPVLDIEDGDLIRNEDNDLRPFPEATERFTGVRTVFKNPNKQWNDTESPLRTDQAALDQEGEPRIAKLNLEAVFSRKQAQRLGRGLLKDSMRRRVHRLVLGPHASHLKPFQVIRWNSDENGYVGKTFMIEKKSVDPLTLTTTLVIRERDNSDYAWSPTDELPEAAVDSTKRNLSLGPIPGAAFEQFRVKDGSGKDRRSAIRAKWTVPLKGIRTLQIKVRNVATGELVYRGTTQDLEEGAHEITGGIVPGVAYEGAMRGLRRKTAWTAWLPVTAPDVKLKKEDIGDGEITDEKILGMSVSKFQGLIQDAQMAGISASKLQGLVQSAQVNTLDAVKLIGSIPKERITAVPVGSLDGQIADANIAGLSASKLAGLIADTQIQTLSASKLSGLVQSAQINTVDAQKLFGTVAEARIASVNATKIAGQITGVQIGPNAVTAEKIAGRTITAAQIATGTLSANEIAAGAIGADQIAADAISARHMVMGSNGDVLNLAFGYPIELDDWYNHSGAGELEVRTTTNASVGGAVLKVGNRSGDDQAWMHYKRLYPYDPKKLYRVTVRVYKAATDPGTVYFGFDGFDEAKNRCNTGGTSSWSSQHYFVASGQSPSGWVEYVGYVKGYGGGREGVSTNSIDNPSTMHANVRYFAPMFIANYSNQPGIVEIDFFKVEEVIPGELIVNGAITGEKIVGRTIDAGKIATGTLTATEIKGRAITAATIATNAITSNEIAVRTIVAGNLVAGTITAYEIKGRAITANEIATGTLTANEIKAGAIGADQIAANAIAAKHLLIGDFVNYAAGSDFETQEEVPWAGMNGDVYTSSTRPKNGSRSLRANPTHTSLRLERKVSVAPGEVIYAAFWCYTSGFNGDSGTNKLRFGDAGNSYVSALDYRDSNNTWTRRETSFTVPAGVTSLTIDLSFNFTSGNVWIDDIVIRKKLSGELIVDGAIRGNHIEANSISSTEIKSRTITAGNIVSGTITANELGASSVTADKILAGAVTAAKINVNNLSAISADLGSIKVDGAHIENLTVDTAHIKALSVGTDKIKDRDVSNYATSYLSGTKTLSGTTQVNTLSFKAVHDNKVHIHVNIELDVASSNQYALIIRRDGNIIYSAATYWEETQGNGGGLMSSSFVADATIGTNHTWSVDIGSSSEGSASNRFMSVTELKK